MKSLPVWSFAVFLVVLTGACGPSGDGSTGGSSSDIDHNFDGECFGDGDALLNLSYIKEMNETAAGVGGIYDYTWPPCLREDGLGGHPEECEDSDNGQTQYHHRCAKGIIQQADDDPRLSEYEGRMKEESCMWTQAASEANGCKFEFVCVPESYWTEINDMAGSAGMIKDWDEMVDETCITQTQDELDDD